MSVKAHEPPGAPEAPAVRRDFMDHFEFGFIAGTGVLFALLAGFLAVQSFLPVATSFVTAAGQPIAGTRLSLAPGATLRFKLLPRKRQTAMDGVELEVAADSVAIPLEVAPDRTFALERDALALQEKARVRPNRKAGTLTWRAEVRTPGLPPDTRRLGDLRLECEVGMKARLVSDYPPSFFGWLDELFPEGPTYCHRTEPRYLFFAERPLFGVTLVDGARREALPVDRLYAGATRYASLGAQTATNDAAVVGSIRLDAPRLSAFFWYPPRWPIPSR